MLQDLVQLRKYKDVLFHGSPIQNLNTIVPLKKNIVAFDDPVRALLSMGIKSEEEGFYGGKPGSFYLCERIAGIFEKKYSRKKGSIYTVSPEQFINYDSFPENMFFSKRAVTADLEIQIDNCKEIFDFLAKRGEFTFIPYDLRLVYFPNDDKVLIKYFKTKILKDADKCSDSDEASDETLSNIESFRQNHPGLVARMLNEQANIEDIPQRA